jgi:tripartite-type tricarboxylate transporter receptor subunit TctC
VPYRGGGPSLTGLLGGQVDLMFDPTQTIVPQIQSGTVKPIAVSTPSRTPELPDVPTIAEAGLPGFDVQSWVGVVGPPNMPKAVLDSVHQELVRALRSPEVSNRLRELANQPVGNSPEEFTEYLKSEVARWSKLIKDAKITPPE